MRLFVGLISLVGTLLFGAALLLSFASPIRIEAFAQELLKREVAARVGDSLSAVERSAVGQFAQRLAEKHPEQVASLKRQVTQRVVPLVEAVVAEMRDPACPCRQKLSQMLDATLPPGRLADLLQPGGRLTTFIEGKYAEVRVALLREFRIFTGANALMFALLGVVLYVRRGARSQLLLPVAVLLLTALSVGYLYLFQQDWLHAIVFSDYLGWGYFVHLAVVGALVADLLFNRARASTSVVNLFLSAIGSAATASAC
ncbi:hypothetical protein [Tahibacter sp.]|uniref:hypothetical protein n=1 Tax=Tahibacter sp. TaxID=2056211 RepID=UPI0028C407D9|nr:hypothetical protein [Tahibacter sp.]